MVVSVPLAKFRPWEVWYAKFPYEEGDGRYSKRPVIVLHADCKTVLVVKVTCHSSRHCDRFDVNLKDWEAAHLNRPSVARISKVMEITPDNFVMKIGDLHNTDAFAVFRAYSNYIRSIAAIKIPSIFNKVN